MTEPIDTAALRAMYNADEDGDTRVVALCDALDAARLEATHHANNEKAWRDAHAEVQEMAQRVTDEKERLRAENAILTAGKQQDANVEAAMWAELIALRPMRPVVEAARALIERERNPIRTFEATTPWMRLKVAVTAYEAQQGEKP